MSAGPMECPPLERILAEVLHYGTWLASAVIAVGLALALGESILSVSGLPIVTAGIAMFILLPVVRVILMLIVFVRERDYRFAAIAATVLAVIVLGLVVGTILPGRVGH
jgi:uncharacterized membrane protein